VQSYLCLLCSWEDGHVPPYPAFGLRGGLAFCHPPDLHLPSSWVDKACSTVMPSYWLRWGLANLLLELASNRNPPSPYPPGITGMSHHVQPNNRCLLRAKENYIMWYQLTCCTTILIISDCQITKPTTWQSTEVIQMPKMIMNLTFCVPQTGYRKNPVIKARASENICFLRYFNYILATSEVFLSL
jgi:hypothetical protein